MKLARVWLAITALTSGVQGLEVTYQPYIQPGDAASFGPTDQMVVAWQTDETGPSNTAYVIRYGMDADLEHAVEMHPTGRVVDNYLSVDPLFSAFPISTAYGAHTDYYGVLAGLKYDSRYYFRVLGPGLPPGGFASSFRTRSRKNRFSFQVQGDEGYYPGIPNTGLIANYEARIVHTMYDVDQLALPGQPKLPRPDLALNTGDNVYVAGGDSNYHDVWFRTWNNNTDSNETGAPFIRTIPFYIVAGNHDVGSTGATANLLADNGPTTPGSAGPGPFGGGLSGGDALAYFNNYYFSLNGPTGVDIQQRFHGDVSAPSNFFFQNNGFNGGAAVTAGTAFDKTVEALRASSAVNTGGGLKRQIDHMSNYSFDYGNTHFVFLDANPHLFDNQLPGDATYASAPGFPFPPYPPVLADWLIHDLDASNQTWKVVVYHQPAFSSGNATLRNDQMRNVAKLLEDHGVNLVFNGHEHNYQRTFPVRALAGVTAAPNPSASAAVAIDAAFNGVSHSVPDGVIYFVEGAGGNRDFDDALGNPRGSSAATIDQDDSASGASVALGGHSFPNGPASWLDTNLTNTAMEFLPGFAAAGSGPKITTRFKAKVFSFADITVDDNSLTLYQISEPLSNSSSATAANPLPFGTDMNGNRLNDPIPDTVIDPVTGNVTSPPATGTSALLDKITVVKPELDDELRTELSAPEKAEAGASFAVTCSVSNHGGHNLNGTQVVFDLPEGVQYAGPAGSATADGNRVVVTLGRFAVGDSRSVELALVASKPGAIRIAAFVRSATALPTEGDEIKVVVNP
jgi:hypothetical protein